MSTEHNKLQRMFKKVTDIIWKMGRYKASILITMSNTKVFAFVYEVVYEDTIIAQLSPNPYYRTNDWLMLGIDY